MDTVLAPNVVDRCSRTGLVKPKTIELIFDDSQLGTQQYWGVRSKAVLLGNIMCPSGATCIGELLFQWN